MDFVQNRHFDWEPSTFNVWCGTRSWKSPTDIELRLVPWFEQRAQQHSCACDLKYLDASVIDDTSFHLACQWLCKKCLPSFVEYLDHTFADVQRIEAGEKDLPRVRRQGPEFVAVAGREIELEDGTMWQVDDFRISRYPVSIEAFDRFVKATGYVTSAEQAGDDETYLLESEGLTEQDRQVDSVTNVSYDDATAFCRWAGVRLPSEAEWVAASLIDEAVLTQNEYNARQFGMSSDPRALKCLASEITGTLVDKDKQCIFRNGPKWARKVNWRENLKNQRIVALSSDTDRITSFRVVKL